MRMCKVRFLSTKVKKELLIGDTLTIQLLVSICDTITLFSD